MGRRDGSDVLGDGSHSSIDAENVASRSRTALSTSRPSSRRSGGSSARATIRIGLGDLARITGQMVGELL